MSIPSLLRRASRVGLISISILLVPAGATLAAEALPEDPPANSLSKARQVALRFDHILRESHDTLMTRFTLSTCNYVIEDSTARCAEDPRQSVIENFLKFYGKDIRSVALVREPPRERGIGMLNYEYYSPNQDNATWMYLPALGKIRRVVSGDDGDEGAFFGSEFLVEDLDYRKPAEYSFKILDKTTVRADHVDGPTERPAYVLEWTPSSSRASKSSYGRIVTWIDAERYIRLRSELYNHQGERFKIRISRGIEKLDGHWWPRREVMRNLKNQRVSIIDRQATIFDHPIPDEFLTQRVLTDNAFRQRYLDQFRRAWR